MLARRPKIQIANVLMARAWAFPSNHCCGVNGDHRGFAPAPVAEDATIAGDSLGDFLVGIAMPRGPAACPALPPHPLSRQRGVVQRPLDARRAALRTGLRQLAEKVPSRRGWGTWIRTKINRVRVGGVPFEINGLSGACCIRAASSACGPKGRGGAAGAPRGGKAGVLGRETRGTYSGACRANLVH
jgi:hypothetical protein